MKVKGIKEGLITLVPYTKDRTTASGMIIPEDVQSNKPMIMGVVETHGRTKPVIFKCNDGEVIELFNGDVVLYQRGRGTEVEIDGETYIYIEINHISTVLDENDDLEKFL